MADYFNIKNAPILNPPANTSLGNSTNQYQNVFVQSNLVVGNTTFTSATLGAPKITSITYPGDDTAADTAGGQTITLTGSGFAAGATIIINGSAVGVVTVVSSTTITFVSPANSAGSYVIYVVNTDGSTAIAIPGIQYSGTPTWTTAAGSLGSVYETTAISNTVVATGDAPVTYSLQSGTLPATSTLASNGLISGTAIATASPTTYTFTIRATDAQQQDTDRSFSLTINPDVVTWSSPANGTTYTSAANSAISNVALSATSAAGYAVSYSANTLPTGLSISGSNITGTPTVVANSSSLLTATAATTLRTATQVINWVINVANDPYFNYVTTLLSANNPSSTFVTDASTNNFAVTVNGDTRPNSFGPYTPGYYSGYFDGTGDYLTVPYTTSAFDWWSSSYTLEAWIYPTTLTGWYYLDSAVNKGTIIGNNAFNGATNYWSLGLNSSGNLWFAYYNGANQGGGTSTTVTLNAWNHIALVVNGSNITLYLNGVGTSLGSIAGTPQSSAGTTLTIGAGNNTYVNGYISNLRIVKGTAVYTSNFTPPTSPLTAIANTNLLICQSNRFIDTSTNAYTVTRNGDTLISGFDPFAPNSSYSTYGSGYFDGSGDQLSIADNAAFTFGLGDFSIEFWLYQTVNSISYLVSQNTGTTSSSSFDVNVNNLTIGGTIYYGASFVALSGGTISLNTWNHIVFARSGTTLSLYLNGTRTATGSAGVTINDASTPVTISGIAGASYPVTGYISDVRILKGSSAYDTTLSTITVPTAPLTAIANTQLLTLQNNQPTNNSMFLDSSTNNFNITRNGNTTQGSFSPYGGGWSNYFDGTGDYLTSTVTGSVGSGDFTIECWVYITGALTNAGVWQLAGSAFPGSVSGLAVSYASPNWQIYYNGTNSLSSTGGSPTANTWLHLALVRSGSSLRFYVNGVLNNTLTDTGNYTSTTLVIGGYYSTSFLMTGYISNFRVVKGTAVYPSAFTPPTAPLTPIVNTSLLTCADNRFIDDSANNFTVTKNGDVSIQRFNPFNPVLTTPTSYSGYFDGTGDYLNFTGYALGSGNFTIEAWVYLTSLPNAANALYSNGTSDSASAISAAAYVSSGGNLGFYNYPTATTTSSTISLNTWTHVAIVRNSSTITLYINGVSGATVSNSNNISDTAVQIMRGFGGITSSPVGYMSNLRVVVGTAVYTSNFTPSTTPLTAVANTRLLTLQNATFIDNSTNNYTITSNGDSVPRQFNPFGWTNTTGSSAAYSVTNYGGSMYFDGNGDYLSVPNNTALNFMNSNYTVEALIYPIATPGATYGACVLSNTTNASNGWLLRLTGSLQFSLVYPGVIAYNFGPVISLNTWNHVAIVRNGSQVTGYVNGVGYSLTNTTPAETNGPWNIGYAFLDYFTGYISNLRIAKGAAVYTSNFAVPVAPLSFNANTTLQVNGIGASIYDSSMISTYETVGNASTTGVIKKYGNSSMSFDGSGDYLKLYGSPNFQFGTGNFTIECWFNGVSVAGGVLFDFRPLSINGAYPCLYLLSGTIKYYVNTADQISGGSLSTSTWYHIAVCRSGSSTKLFVNGTQVGSTYTDTNNYGASSICAIGATSHHLDGTNPLYGYLDDFRITRGVARYTANFTPPTTPFIQN